MRFFYIDYFLTKITWWKYQILQILIIHSIKFKLIISIQFIVKFFLDKRTIIITMFITLKFWKFYCGKIIFISFFISLNSHNYGNCFGFGWFFYCLYRIDDSWLGSNSWNWCINWLLLRSLLFFLIICIILTIFLIILRNFCLFNLLVIFL